ncbi:MAG: BspA family leucine-rich repeat surface protein, partial [Gammaproteobacteria bacterium]|nr:BspA family leucine-rich repeat surface protein [Gammaproteobacteria bacterium]
VDIVTNLTNGRTYVIKAKMIDKAGNPSGFSATHTITIDTSAPTAPSITRIEDDVDPITGNIANNGKTNDTTPTVQVNLTGTGADAGSTVELYDDTTKIGTATLTVENITNNTVDIVTNLTNGHTYVIKAKMIDKAGNPSGFSATHTITIDTSAPNAPTLDLLGTDDTGISDSDNKTNKTSVTITGKAEANSSVELLDGDRSLGKTTTGSDGNFSRVVTLEEGVTNITAKATDIAGNISPASAALSVTVDITPPSFTIEKDGGLGTVKAGGFASLIFLLSEPSKDFTEDDIIVTYKGDVVDALAVDPTTGLPMLRDFAAISGRMYKVDYYPTADISGNVEISVASDAFTDVAGNKYKQPSGVDNFQVSVNTIVPTVTITANTASLKKNETAIVTFDFSKSPYDADGNIYNKDNLLSIIDVTGAGGVLSNVEIDTADATIYTATFTPDSAEGNATIKISKGAFQNKIGNKNKNLSHPGNKFDLAVDTISPTVSISSEGNIKTLKVGQVIEITFEWSEPLLSTTDFTRDDIEVDHDGKLHDLKVVSGSQSKKYTANFFVNKDNFTKKISISVKNGAVTDTKGNTNQDAADNKISFDVDAVLPIAKMITPGVMKNDVTNIQIESSEEGVAYLVAWKYGRTELAAALDSGINLENTNSDEVKKINIDAVNTPTNIAVTGLKDGDYRLFTVDTLGNVSQALGRTNSITIDRTPPDIDIGSVTTSWVGELDLDEAQTDKTLTVSIADMTIEGQTVTLHLNTNNRDYYGVVANGQAIITIPSTYLQNLSQGEHTYTLNLEDAAGNSASQKTGTFRVAKAPLLIEGSGSVDTSRLITFDFDGAVTGFGEADIAVQNGALIAGSFKEKTGATNQYTIEVTQNTNGGTHENIAITVAKNSFTINGNSYRFTFKNTTSLELLSQKVLDGFNFINFDTSHAITAVRAFKGSASFNDDISGWSTGSVTNMLSMFNGATGFNQNISTWDTQNVTNMKEMFKGATAFNQDLGRWNILSLTQAETMFTDSGMDLANMDKTLQ